MAADVKLLQKPYQGSPQVCIVPVSNVAATKVYRFLEVLFVL